MSKTAIEKMVEWLEKEHWEAVDPQESAALADALAEARRLASLESKPPANADIVGEIKQIADMKYCQALDLSKRTECLGWEYKSKNGLFGTPEFKAHEKVNILIGEQKGLYLALEILSRYRSAVDTKEKI